MNLLEAVAFHTLEKVNTQSQHSLLMRFWEIDKELQKEDEADTKNFDDYLDNKITKKQYNALEAEYKSGELVRLFKTVEAKSILMALNIL